MPITKTTVTGPILDATGAPYTNASVVFTPSAPVRDDPNDTVIAQTPVVVVPNAVTGAFSIDLAPSDTVSYSVSLVLREACAEKTYRIGPIYVPDAGTVALEDLLPLFPISAPTNAELMAIISAAAESSHAASEAAQISAEAAAISAEAGRGLAFRRKLAIALPWTTETLRTMNASTGAAVQYPQSFCFNTDGTQVFVLHGPAGGSISSFDVFITAYDITDRTSPVLLSTFRLQTGTSREYLIHRQEGPKTYLYAGGATNPKRFDITSMPSDGAVVAAETTFTGINNYSHAAFDGRSWLFATGIRDPLTGESSKGHVHVWSADLSTRLAEYWLPSSLSSSYANPMLDGLVKSQSFCWHKGKLWFALGGVYGIPETGTGDLDSRLQGIASYDPIGRSGAAYVAPGPSARLRFADCFGIDGADMPVIETEGITSNGGDLYTLWTTLNGTIWDTSEALTRGIYITKELSTDADATDFSDLAAIPRDAGFNAQDASYYTWNADQTGNLRHPITGAALLTLKNIADAMMECGMASVRVYTTGITVPITDPDGVNIGSGLFINMYHNRKFGCNVELIGLAQHRRWWYSGGTFFEDKMERASDGSMRIGAPDQRNSNPPATDTASVTINPQGQVFASAAADAPLVLGRGNVGYLAPAYRGGALVGGLYAETDRLAYRFSPGAWVSGGAGSPEGVIAGTVGSQWNRTDGAGEVYIKTSGTGNTGWLLLSAPDVAALADGTAALPSMAFASDPDTGFYRPAANQIGASTGGVRRWLLSNTAFQVDVPITGTAVTQSITDATVGRLLRVEHAPWNKVGYLLADMDAEPTVAGPFTTSSADTAGTFPTSQKFGSGFIVKYGGGDWNIYFHNVLDDALFLRRYRSASGGWQAWRRVYDSGNIVGTVSQASGVPTGAIFEKPVSAASGWTRKTADGNMECRHTLTLSAAGATTWAFPSTAFVEAPTIEVTAIATASASAQMDAAPSTTAVSLSAWNTSNARVASVVHVTAKGRWSALT